MALISCRLLVVMIKKVGTISWYSSQHGQPRASPALPREVSANQHVNSRSAELRLPIPAHPPDPVPLLTLAPRLLSQIDLPSDHRDRAHPNDPPPLPSRSGTGNGIVQ
jgi:hypothetical protein